MFTRFANPARFDQIARTCLPWLWAVAAMAIGCGLVDALLLSPPDYQQSETVRIMYVHVPSAWLAMGLYSACALSGLMLVVWKHTMADMLLRAIIPVGAVATALCLVTGMLWGQPMWGTWWVWDARLTSVLVLLFQYLGLLALLDAFDRPEQGSMAAGWLAVIGVINIPIIKYSVLWWATLHQPDSLSSIKRVADPAMPPEMIRPLLLMALGLTCLSAAIVLVRTRTEVLRRKLQNKSIPILNAEHN